MDYGIEYSIIILFQVLPKITFGDFQIDLAWWRDLAVLGLLARERKTKRLSWIIARGSQSLVHVDVQCWLAGFLREAGTRGSFGFSAGMAGGQLCELQLLSGATLLLEGCPGHWAASCLLQEEPLRKAIVSLSLHSDALTKV